MRFHRSASRFTHLAGLIAIAFPCVGHAEDATLPVIHVRGAAARADLQPDSLANPSRVEATGRVGTEILSREDIEALAPRDVMDLLDKAVGMNLTYHGRKHPFFLEERGGGNLTYILDGAILPGSADRMLHKIPLAAIEQIEIVRGSTSLALGPIIPIGSSISGSGINTGFVVIRTRQPKGTEAEISAFIEKADSKPSANGQTLYAGTQLGTQDGAGGYFAGALSRKDAPSNDTRFDGQDADAQMAVGGFGAGRFSFGVTAYQDKGRWEMQRGVTVAGALDNSKWYYDPLKTAVLAGNLGMAWSPDQVTLLALFGTKYRHTEYDESFDPKVAWKPSTYAEEESGGWNLRHNARFGGTLVQLGALSTRNEGYGPNTSNQNRWRSRVDGWSAAVEQKMFADRLVLDAGYRRDRKHIDSFATSSAPGAKTGNNDADLAPARTLALGARWKFDDAYALSGRYFDGDEGTSGSFDLRTQSGTPLHAETQRRREIALEANLLPYFRPTVTWFDLDGKNQKTATNNTYAVNGQTYYYYTEGDIQRRGVELLVKGDIARKTSYSIGLTHLTLNNTTSAGATTDNIGLNQPKNSLTGRIGHAWDNWRANLSIKRVDSWTQSVSAMGTANDVSLGGYTRVDANVLRDFRFGGHGATVEIYGRNLGNSHYATRYTTGYYDDPGRVIGLQATLRY